MGHTTAEKAKSAMILMSLNVTVAVIENYCKGSEFVVLQISFSHIYNNNILADQFLISHLQP